MKPAVHLLTWNIALLTGAVLVPAHAQSPQTSPLPKAPPEIMSQETPPAECQQMSAEQGDKLRIETTGTSLSEQPARSDGVLCPPSGIKALSPNGGRMDSAPAKP